MQGSSEDFASKQKKTVGGLLTAEVFLLVGAVQLPRPQVGAAEQPGDRDPSFPG